MKVVTVNGNHYRLPNLLNNFQQDMYIHLINWKWKYITKEPGLNRGIACDTFLPESVQQDWPLIYPEVKDALNAHLKNFPFRIHKFFNHVASSQVANINLFLPVLQNTNADIILGAVKSDFATLAKDKLFNGYQIEFSDGVLGSLGDKTDVSGTDSDIAIAYRNHQGELCLWLIEHKLTEKEFTECGGFKSEKRKKAAQKYDCDKNFSEILKNKSICYYHAECGFKYWTITVDHKEFFVNHANYPHCPFQGGMNQLWRNQLLALSIEQAKWQGYKHIFFSVVKHPLNESLDMSIKAYKDLIDNNPKFSVFTSADVINAASKIGDESLSSWIEWYKGLYNL